jgi:hypothetical protein
MLDVKLMFIYVSDEVFYLDHSGTSIDEQMRLTFWYIYVLRDYILSIVINWRG